jgi:hypothetical protein
VPKAAAAPRDSVHRANANKSWTADEEARLAERFQNGSSIRVLAEAHGRTDGAVRSRLAKLGLILR